MAARRKTVSPEKPTTLPPGEAPEPIEQPEHIEVKQESTIHNLVIPDRMYERMRNIGNDEYWLRIIDSHIEIMMTRYHQ